MSLPIWLFALLVAGASYGIYAAIKNFFTEDKKHWPKHIPQKREIKDKDEQTRRDFVANVSHELRTPVSIIKGFADSLHEDYEILSDTKRKSFLIKIQKNGKRLNSLVEDLLVLAKLEKPKTTLAKESVDLCALARNIEEEFTQRNEASTVRMMLECPMPPLHVTADPQKLVSVFENLIDNALIHAEGLSLISVRLEKQSHNKSILCEVEDDGTGISQEDQEMLFERFYRVDKGRSRKRGGTGLGLSIAREIVEVHGGESSVRSKIGNGTIFAFEIPLGIPPAQ
jgi:two-component system phosphate regulon sensor histidine kinase PhoR